ncbi:MAG: glycosyltransferase family 4 protein [Elainellaceae cyanobacterium]
MSRLPNEQEINAIPNKIASLHKLTKNVKTKSTAENLSNSDRPLMLFDLSVRGHHPAYIQHLIEYFVAESLSGYLVVVVSPRFFEEHHEVIDLSQRHAPDQIKFQAISWAEEKMLGQRKTAKQRLKRSAQEWRLLLKYAKALNAKHCLALYFDTCLRPLAVSKPLPCSISGIYFRPTFHYPMFAQYQPSYKDRFRHWWEQMLLVLMGQRSHLHMVFSLDPFAVPQLNRLLGQSKAVHLPDPVALDRAPLDRVQQLRAELEVDSGRTVALIFGALTRRKGVPKLLEAIAQLSPNEAQKLCLLLIGESNISEDLDNQITGIMQRLPAQIICRYEFVPEADVSAYFQLADIVLAPYQQHVGMSGILLQAAAAGKPVLSSNYGLMGELVTRYQLGLTVDSTKPEAIAQGLKQCLDQPTNSLGNLSQMQNFAQQNSARWFAQTIFQSILPIAHYS